MNGTDCPDFSMISSHADDETSPYDSARVRKHLEDCAACRQKYNSLLLLHADFEPLRTMPQVDMVADVKRRIDAIPTAGRCFGWLPMGVIPFAMAASLALFIGIGLGSRLVIDKGDATLTNSAQMALFSAMPPGNICLGHDSCFSWRGPL